ncbi:MAG: hypothetical protein CMG71_05985 [Candidatus Marinimicrobia bacterium]|nr:hypothetical protein [Candidatus Neomarinimicrobiota bacterium]|tara:strand:+ start:9821 stop:10972 length:1152 start_codon:yes stop_codon:yes gene_type:complete
MKLDRFFEGGFGRYVLPGVIMQSVLIGGGYATGREIVEYGARLGSLGWISGLTALCGFSFLSFLTFELARVFKAYDYRSLVKQVAWKFWFLFEIVYVILGMIVIAVMASATGEIVEQTLGVDYWAGVGAITVVVGILNFYGRNLIERFKTFGTAVLYIGYLLFSSVVLFSRWDSVMTVMAAGETSFETESVSVWTAVTLGIVYMGYNLVFAPALFTLRRQSTRKETFWSGMITGVLMTFPWFLTYFCLMGFYPDGEVLGATVPWLVMLERIGGKFLIALFGVVVGWTLIETATGIIHAIVERLHAHTEQVGRPKMTHLQDAIFATGMLVISVGLARIGIIDLIAKGYAAMSYGMIAVYIIPLMTIGVYRILNPDWKSDFWETS